MTLFENKIVFYLVLFIICAVSAAVKCPEGALNCGENCYYPNSEECVNLGHGEYKIVERSEPLTPPPKSQIMETNSENICDLIDEGKIEIEAEGSGISSLSLKIKPKVDFNIKVTIPAGTFFPANRGSSQSMVSTKRITIELEAKPGIDIEIESDSKPSSDGWTHVNVPVACANLHKAIPGSGDTFEVERSPNQEELEKLMPILDAEDASYPVKQAAIWIITDNADYDDLGTLVSDGSRVINEYEAAEAIKFIEKAGINIKNKAIWEDRERIEKGNTGKPTGYIEGAGILTPCGPCPEGWSGPDENCTCSKCDECPPGWEGPNEKCECWRWETVGSN